MLKHVGVGEEFEYFIVRIGDRDVIVFACEGFDRREILPVGGKKEMLATTQNYFAGRGYPLTLHYF